ncbi:alpha/beta fold hydrolase [Craterilacuibacter sinensis]|uniref:Alpha/beta fold hydrolase n=1 Tax=Craterilacuibacter sinensis TaxID=2686017 RepID=A0A845BLS6_9NEIS|nr:alpha/beta fold hydrolase [Craterilacuibacter sinensis]MXR35411.1 alpha/beta fold hydrolase [Craterilacuibacter sinensis]
MPYVHHDTLAIHYQVWGQPERPALALVFGFGMSARDWLDFGYIAALQTHFYLIAIEVRGHGDSSAPHHPGDYALPAMASDIAAVLDQLTIARATLWGYSLGAKMVLAYAAAQPDRVAALVLGGCEMHAKVDLDNDVVSQALAQGGQAWCSLWQQMFDVPTPLAARLQQADTASLLALRQAEARWPDLSDAPARLAMPCLLYAGEHCFYRAATAAMAEAFPNSRYLQRSGRTHFDLMPDSAWICHEVIASFARPAII